MIDGISGPARSLRPISARGNFCRAELTRRGFAIRLFRPEGEKTAEPVPCPAVSRPGQELKSDALAGQWLAGRDGPDHSHRKSRTTRRKER